MAKETAISQRFSSSSHDTLGSRKSAMCRSSTGLRGIAGPGPSVVAAVCEVLCLPCSFARAAGAGVDRNQALAPGAQRPLLFLRSTTTLPVNTISPSFSGIATGSSCQCRRSRANGVPPTHVAPFITERIELKEQVILPVKERPGR